VLSDFKESGMDGVQTGQSTAENRIPAQRQDLMLRNMNLKPILGLMSYRSPLKNILSNSRSEINFTFFVFAEQTRSPAAMERNVNYHPMQHLV